MIESIPAVASHMPNRYQVGWPPFGVAPCSYSCPAMRLAHLVDARPPRQRTGVAVRREVAVHDAGVHRLGLLVSETEALGDAGAEVVVHHVSRGDQVARHLAAVCAFRSMAMERLPR